MSREQQTFKQGDVRSTAFNEGLAPTTRQNRRAILERFREEHGDKRIAMMHRTAIQVILNKRSAVAARNWKKALRELAHLAKASGG